MGMRLLAVAALMFASVASGKSLYVNNSGTPACSDATTYAANTAAAPWCTIGRAAWGDANRATPNASQAAAAGDTVYIAEGTYTTTGTNDRKIPAYNPVNAGTSGNQITFVGVGTVILTYSSGVGPMIGASNELGGGAEYITWRNFTINEVNAPFSPDTGVAVIWYSSYNVIENVIFNGVGQTSGGGYNHSAIRIEGGVGGGGATLSNVIRNNTITNFKVDNTDPPTINEWNANGACIMLYFADSTIIENNLISVCGSGIYVKGNDHVRTTIRLNYIHTAGTGILFQYSGTTGRSKIYQNIIRCQGTVHAGSGWGIAIREYADNVDVVNNTVVGCGAGFSYGDPITSAVFRNNIVYQTSADIWVGSTTSWGQLSTDTNAYYSQQRFYEGAYTTIADWRTALGGCPNTGNDCDTITSDPLFVNYATYNYKLQVGSPALTVGVDILDLDGDGDTADTIPAGAYITGSEVIGPTGLLAAPGRPRWRPLSWWMYLLYAGTLQ